MRELLGLGEEGEPEESGEVDIVYLVGTQKIK
jgi:hypothetical protein